MVVVHGRCLKLAADTEPIDLVFTELEQIVFAVVPHQRPAVRRGASSDQVEEGGLARAVRTNDRPQLALVQIEIEVVDCLIAIKRFVEAFGG